MKPKNRKIWILGIALLIVAYILLAAPGGQPRVTGSTYNRAPEGYGAWYAYLEEQGYDVTRWRRPFSQFPTADTSQVYVQIAPGEDQQTSESSLSILFDQQPLLDWVNSGNTLVLLRTQGFPTEAPFTSRLQSDYGEVMIETSRRQSEVDNVILGDRHGAIVWKIHQGEGQIIVALTPFLGANAYQDEPGNFEFLTSLVSVDNAPIWIDEFIHGYRDLDADTSQTKQQGNWATYLLKTPLILIAGQVVLMMVIMIVAQNQRLGLAQRLKAKSTDNSEAYIQALAGVLDKADRHDFVVKMVTQDTQLRLQRALGLGSQRLEIGVLLGAWSEQTGRKPEELEQWLKTAENQNLSRRQLKDWIQKLEDIEKAAQISI